MRRPMNLVPGFQRCISAAICSHIDLASAYPLSGFGGCASVNGAATGRLRVNGKPNTVSLDAHTTRLRPNKVAALKILYVLIRLF